MSSATRIALAALALLVIAGAVYALGSRGSGDERTSDSDAKSAVEVIDVSGDDEAPADQDPSTIDSQDESREDDDTDDEQPEPDTDLIEVADVVGMDVASARTVLIDSGLLVELESSTNNEIPVDEVFGQDPPSGERVEADAIITLDVSSGTSLTVPNVIGESQESATSILNEKGYAVTVVTATASQDAGTVVGQSPQSGDELGPGGSVEIWVSSGPGVVPVPDVEGFTVIDAFNALRDAGFNVSSTQVEESSEEIEAGLVIRTEPEKGDLEPQGAQVSVVVSTGFPKVLVPDLTNLFADTAIQTLRNNGLDPVPVFEAVAVGSAQAGRVISQTPAAFSEVDAGSVVTIVVGEPT